MRKYFEIGCYLALFVLMILSIYQMTTFRFAHPEMTETQLFSANWRSETHLLLAALAMCTLSVSAFFEKPGK